MVNYEWILYTESVENRNYFGLGIKVFLGEIAFHNN